MLLECEIKAENTYPTVEEKVIRVALRCLEKRVIGCNPVLGDSGDVYRFLQLQLSSEPNEVFAVLFLDNAHRMIAFEKLFFGTINYVTVHPRVVVQKALSLNSAAVIFVHNHPSGMTEPSISDKQITQELKKILAVINICVLDHVIVGAKDFFSFVDKGLL